MASLRTTFAGVAAFALAGVASAQQCLEKYNCIFRHDVNGQEYSWDLHQLCRQPGNEYSYTDAFNHTVSVNICGNTSALCAPTWPLYDSHGVVVQQWTSNPPCGAPPGTCTDWDFGTPTCCTGECAVLGTEFFQFSLVNNNNPLNGGVVLTHVGMPPDDSDPFNCPINPSTGLSRERQVSIILSCDPNGSNTNIVITGVSEPSTCSYVVAATTKAACGVVGDPYEPLSYPYTDPNQGAKNFGFVVLGVAIAVIMTFAIQFADARGYLDSIKRYMPSIPGFGGGGYKAAYSGSGGGYSGSSSYKPVSAATPISASAYGST